MSLLLKTGNSILVTRETEFGKGVCPEVGSSFSILAGTAPAADIYVKGDVLSGIVADDLLILTESTLGNSGVYKVTADEDNGHIAVERQDTDANGVANVVTNESITNIGSGSDITFSNTDSKISISGLATGAVAEGDLINITGATTSGNNGIYVASGSNTGDDIPVDTAPAADESGDTGTLADKLIFSSDITVLKEGFDAANKLGILKDSDMSPATEFLERDILNGAFVNCAGVSGKETSSGSLNVELGVLSDKLIGHDVIETGLGKYNADMAAVDETAGTITVGAGGAYDLYSLSAPGDNQLSLAARIIYGANDETSMNFNGVAVESVAFDFPSGQIAKVSTSVSGVSWDTTYNAVGVTNECPAVEPFVVKNASFKLGNVTLDATDVNITINNTLTDIEGVTGSGITNKVVVSKSIEASFTVEFEDNSQLAEYKKNKDVQLFVQLVNTTGDEVAIYLPKARRSEVSIGDNSDVLTQSIKLTGYNDTDGNAVLIATKTNV